MFWKKGKSFSDGDIIEGFRKTDPRVVNYVYLTYYKTIELYIVKHGGKYDDVKDVFQEGLSVVFQKVQQDDFVLNCSFITLLFSICKNLWLLELRRRKYSKDVESSWGREEGVEDSDTESVRLEYIQERKETLFRKHYSSLNEECQQVIRLYLKKLSFREIASIMGYESERMAIKRKSRCKEILIRRVKSDPAFGELY
ncbi:MAG TPA: sigma-70 family RNA polymerase sigma factor [Bacteroidales bacterium]|nr:sigma-70 family RNA polymerase sigma factor [Bacteroidales bacterium]HSA43102.1 sigma-70 family RNA polymerase sigma factor [Bacteroidales bacterium]